MVNLIKKLHNEFSEKKQIKLEKEKIQNSVRRLAPLVKTIFDDIKSQYSYVSDSGYFLDILSLSLGEHKYIDKNRRKTPQKDVSFVVLDDSFFGTKDGQKDPSKKLSFKNNEIMLKEKNFKDNELLIFLNNENKKNEIDICLNLNNQTQLTKSFFMYGIEKKYEKKGLDFYKSEEFYNLNQILIDFEKALKNSIKLYSFTLILIDCKASKDEMVEFVKEFKDCKEIFHILLPLLADKNQGNAITFIETVLENGVDLNKKEIREHFKKILICDYQNLFEHVHLQAGEMYVNEDISKIINSVDKLILKELLSKDLSANSGNSKRMKV